VDSAGRSGALGRGGAEGASGRLLLGRDPARDRLFARRFEGDRITARTWVGEAPKGAKFDRHVEFTGNDGRVCVRSRTDWAIIDKAAARPIRVPPEVVAPFMAAE
jgi:hypothetical protein